MPNGNDLEERVLLLMQEKGHPNELRTEEQRGWEQRRVGAGLRRAMGGSPFSRRKGQVCGYREVDWCGSDGGTVWGFVCDCSYFLSEKRSRERGKQLDT